MTHRCRVAGTFANRRQLQWSANTTCDAVYAVQLVGTGECGSNAIQDGGIYDVRTVILLKAFHEEYPNIRQEISTWILDNSGESELKDFMFELLAELQPKD